ncbi:MAG: hypothetical protein Q8Q60_04575 [Candidatus Chromulinivorax sp.]|nr:hypothetical protein [Candidatus Chromulinivorax sp.]
MMKKLLLFVSLLCHGHLALTLNFIEPQVFTYYLSIDDFVESFIEIPTSNVTDPSSTTSSTYLAGRATLYDENDEEVGICSASFLCMQTGEIIYNDIANYISIADGLIVTWFTPTTLANLELDSIVNSMVTECIVFTNTKVGLAPLYQQTFSLVVSSDQELERIYFQFTRQNNIF